MLIRLKFKKTDDDYVIEQRERAKFLANDENRAAWEEAIGTLIQTYVNYNACIPGDIGRMDTRPEAAFDDLCWQIRDYQRLESLPYRIAAWRVIDRINDAKAGYTSQLDVINDVIKIHQTRRDFERWQHASPKFLSNGGPDL